MKRILQIKGLKYIIVLVIFAIYLVFLDDYSLIATSRLKREVRQLHAEEQALKEAIVADSANAARLRDNLDAKEHYGKEYSRQRRNDRHRGREYAMWVFVFLIGETEEGSLHSECQQHQYQCHVCIQVGNDAIAATRH